MATKYTYSKATNFGGVLYLSIFHAEINASAITPTCYGVNLTGDIVDVYFASTLSAGDEVILLSIISSHPTSTPTGVNSENYINSDTIVPSTQVINTTTHFILVSYNFDGFINTLSDIILNSYMEPDATSYTIQVLDYTNINIIAEETFTNTNDTSLQQLTLSNIPTTQNTIIHIKGKINPTGKKAFLKSIIFKYT